MLAYAWRFGDVSSSSVVELVGGGVVFKRCVCVCVLYVIFSGGFIGAVLRVYTFVVARSYTAPLPAGVNL